MTAAPASTGPGLILGYKGEAGSDVLVFARRWVRASSEPVQVVTVYPGPAPVGPGRVDAEWVAYGREEAERLLGEARTEMTDEVPAGYRSIGADSASHALHDLAEADPTTVVVLGSRKTRGLRRTSPGSTAERMLQGSTGPVALVPWDYESTDDHDLTRVTVAFVDTPDGHAALQHAASLAQRLHASLQVLTVVPDTRVVPSLGDIRRFGQEQRAGYQEALDAALATLPADLHATGELRDGSVVDALTDLTSETTDLLICGSRGYGPALRVLLGGVSSRVLRNARVPVIVVPRGR